MAGRAADGVFLRVGRDPANLLAAIESVRAGLSEAACDPNSMTINLVIDTITSQNPEDIAAISRSMAAGFFEYSPALFDIPGIPWDGPPIGALKERVQPDFHHATDLVAAGNAVAFLPEQAADGFSLFGAARDVADQPRAAIDAIDGHMRSSPRFLVLPARRSSTPDACFVTRTSAGSLSSRQTLLPGAHRALRSLHVTRPRLRLDSNGG